ncbi:MarR family transcriptional regulator [Streptomyces goshikiensis]|uniref:MarR family transcriptional regulator n=1 Tax=Streptomyces goshikiensis TaxID=1942 RepID=UPI003820359D
MEQPVAEGTNGGAPGAPFVIIGVANTQADWARVLGALTHADLPLGAPPAPGTAAEPAEPAEPRAADAADAAETRAAAYAGNGPAAARGGGVPEPTSATPPSVLDLNAYLVYAIGKAARRRLTAKLTEHGLRLWHLTVLALLSDLGPQSKGTLATRLDMNASDLVKVVNDLSRSGYVECVRDTADRRRVVVELTREGRTAVSRLNADIASTDEEFLAPLSGPERAQLGSLLRRVHRHFDTTPTHTVHEDSDAAAPDAALPRPGGVRSVEALRIDWNRSAEDIENLVRARSRGGTGAYTHHGGRRLEILAATATEGRYDGAPGRVVRSGTDGLVIVAGPDAGAPGRGLSVVRVRTEDGTEMPAADYFHPEGGGLTTGE